MKLFKLIASRAGQVLFDDRVEADSPREAREQMKALLGLQSLTGVVYAITEIPIELIQSIVDAKLAEALQLLQTAYKAKPDAEIAAHLGEVLWVMGQRDAAAIIWREGLLLKSDNDTLNETLKRFQFKP